MHTSSEVLSYAILCGTSEPHCCPVHPALPGVSIFRKSSFWLGFAASMLAANLYSTAVKLLLYCLRLWTQGRSPMVALHLSF
eukprot:c19969_g1_i1 orf=119-364(-)